MTEPEPPASRGADLARAALEAARARNAQRRAEARAPEIRRSRSTGASALRRRRWSGAGPDGRDPAALSSTLRGWIKQAGAGADLTKAAVFGRWPELVGPEIADHARPISLVDGELLLQAESTTWATAIRGLAPQIIARINAEVGAHAIKRVRAQGPAGPSWRFGSRHVSGRGPRDTYG